MKHNSMTLEIDGKIIPIAANPITKAIYKKQFKGDIFKHLKVGSKYATGTVEQRRKSDNIAFQIIWALAKTARKDIQSPDEWLEMFDSFPVTELMPRLVEIIKEVK